MNKLELATRIVLLTLGWALVIARGATIGSDSGTLWSARSLLVVTLVLALVQRRSPRGRDWLPPRRARS